MDLRTYWPLLLGFLLSGCGEGPAGHRPPVTKSVTVAGSPQNPSLDTRIDNHVRLLSDRSIKCSGGVMWTDCVLASRGLEMLLCIGKPATGRLMEALHDPDRDLAAHAVLTVIWGPEKLAHAVDWRRDTVWFSPSVAKSLPLAERHWGRIIVESPVTESDYREAEERWNRAVSKIVPLMPRAQGKL